MKAVIFDYDGVIVDSFEANYLAWKRYFNEKGWTGFSKEYLEELYGSGIQSIARPILKKNGIVETDTLMKGLIKTKTAYAESYINEVVLIDGVKVFLQSLDGLRLAISTGNGKEFVEAVNRKFDIKSLFELVVSSEDVSKGKPEPEGFLIAAERLAISPSECVVFEDHPAGVLAARRAGMKCIAITTTKPASDLSLADMVIDSYSELSLAKIISM